MATMFDTLKAVKDLVAAGFETEKAEAIVGTVGHAFTDQVATKGDLNALGHELRGEIGELRGEITELRGELRSEIADVRGEIRLLKWMVGAVLVFNAGILARMIFTG